MCLVVRPPGGDESAATVDDAVAALERSPLDHFALRTVDQAVADQAGTPAPIGHVQVPPETEGWVVVISSDRLAAYLVPAPVPLAEDEDEDENEAAGGDADEAGDGDDGDADEPSADPRVTVSALERRLGELGIKHGVLREVIEDFDPPRELERILCVAEGVPVIEGRDGQIRLVLDTNE